MYFKTLISQVLFILCVLSQIGSFVWGSSGSFEEDTIPGFVSGSSELCIEKVDFPPFNEQVKLFIQDPNPEGTQKLLTVDDQNPARHRESALILTSSGQRIPVFLKKYAFSHEEGSLADFSRSSEFGIVQEDCHHYFLESDLKKEKCTLLYIETQTILIDLDKDTIFSKDPVTLSFLGDGMWLPVSRKYPSRFDHQTVTEVYLESVDYEEDQCACSFRCFPPTRKVPEDHACDGNVVTINFRKASSAKETR